MPAAGSRAQRYFQVTARGGSSQEKSSAAAHVHRDMGRILIDLVNLIGQDAAFFKMPCPVDRQNQLHGAIIMEILYKVNTCLQARQKDPFLGIPRSRGEYGRNLAGGGRVERLVPEPGEGGWPVDQAGPALGAGGDVVGDFKIAAGIGAGAADRSTTL